MHHEEVKFICCTWSKTEVNDKSVIIGSDIFREMMKKKLVLVNI